MIIIELLQTTIEGLMMLCFILAFMLKLIVDALVKGIIYLIKKIWFVFATTFDALALELLFFYKRVKQTIKMIR